MKYEMRKLKVKFNVNTRGREGDYNKQYDYIHVGPPKLEAGDVVIVETRYGPSLATVSEVNNLTADITNYSIYKKVLTKVNLYEVYRQEAIKFEQYKEQLEDFSERLDKIIEMKENLEELETEIATVGGHLTCLDEEKKKLQNKIRAYRALL